MENKQTAVEFIEYKWGNAVHWNWDEIKQWFETAKQMEKEQMEDMIKWMYKVSSQQPMRLETDVDDIVEQYYTETYGNQTDRR